MSLKKKADPDLHAMQCALNVLSEYYDTVQILAERETDAGTARCEAGYGNSMARAVHAKLYGDAMLSQMSESMGGSGTLV